MKKITTTGQDDYYAFSSQSEYIPVHTASGWPSATLDDITLTFSGSSDTAGVTNLANASATDTLYYQYEYNYTTGGTPTLLGGRDTVSASSNKNVRTDTYLHNGRMTFYITIGTKGYIIEAKMNRPNNSSFISIRQVM